MGCQPSKHSPPKVEGRDLSSQAVKNDQANGSADVKQPPIAASRNLDLKANLPDAAPKGKGGKGKMSSDAEDKASPRTAADGEEEDGVMVDMPGGPPTEEEDGKKLCLKVASGTHIGFGPLKKENQDDLFVAADGFTGEAGTGLFCVFDGHGSEGKTVANYIQGRLPLKLEEELLAVRNRPGEVANDEPYNDAIPEALKKAYIACNKDLVACPIDCSVSGSTVSCALLRARSLYVASCGDSRVVAGTMRRKGLKSGAQKDVLIPDALSVDHRPAREDERRRVEEAGGRVQPKRTEWGQYVGEPRIWLKEINMPGLLVSRAFGDELAASVGCTSEPEVTFRQLDSRKDRWVVMASDGIWDVMDNQMVIDCCDKTGDAGRACQMIIEMALQCWEDRYMADNITVIVVQLLWKDKEELRKRQAEKDGAPGSGDSAE